MEQARLKEKPLLALKRSHPVAPEKVWRAWTDPKAIAKWWGPGGNDPVATAELDLRVGGRFRIVFGGTDLEFLHEQFFDKAARDGHQRGWTESFTKLEQFLKGEAKS